MKNEVSNINQHKADNIKADNKDYTLFPWAAQETLNPIEAVNADGIYIFDNENKKYFDFSSGLMNVNIGHKNTKVNNAIKEQLDNFAYVNPGIATKPRGDLGKKLKEIAPPNMQKTFFTSGGADSIENALIIARMVTGKSKIITRYRSYHGASYAAATAGGDPRKLPIDRDQTPNIIHAEDPYCYRCPWSQEISSCKRECVSHIERIIQFEGPNNIAAILLEGESGSSGCIKYPPDYWEKVAAIAKKNNILLISDEVMSGFGRCGEWFAINKTGVEPDIIAMAKGINSGYIPLGGVMVSKDIAKFFDKNTLPSGLTYSAHSVACASAIANIDFMQEENLLEHTKELGKYLIDQIEVLKTKHKSIGDFRSTGLLGCIELVKNRETKEALVPWNATGEDLTITNKIISKLRELGMITFVRWNFIFIAPPLIITKDEIDEGLSIISEALIIADSYCS
ncbi:MAG: aminotransferase class III-fold pyridoxal phosphate-dependent enzyme [Rickettsiales bacterium]|nr:aminotransferase class III-fold pyridoxal phosphate-dependent enzyme [Rickettsiales bacterium]